MKRWMSERMLSAYLPEDGHAHQLFIWQLGCPLGEAMRAAVTLDGVPHAFDVKRHGARNSAISLMDARLKESRRRHRADRQLPMG